VRREENKLGINSFNEVNSKGTLEVIKNIKMKDMKDCIKMKKILVDISHS